VTLVPDLYRGKVAIDHETAGHYMNDLDWQCAVQDIQAAVNYLRTVRGVKKVGIVGFCMGGALSLASASLVEGIDASAPFYGIGQLGDPALAKCPLQLHFGEKDALVGFSDITAQDSLENKLKEANREFTFYRYEGAGHAFCNPGNQQNFRQDYADLARDRTLEFFAKNLAA
jgi:carboxymethylenebutenolidase